MVPAAQPANVACVVDVRLALGRHGLRAVVGLTGGLETWMPQRLREVIQSPPDLRGPPATLVPLRRGAAAERALAWDVASELALWNGDPDIAALRYYYLGDRADDCRTPSRADRGLRDRCEQLQAGLDLLATTAAEPGRCGEAFAECIRGAAALAAALPYSTFVLTRFDATDDRPAFCAQLEDWGLASRRVEAGLPAAGLMASLAATGVLALRWAGLRFAAVHVVVPGVPILGAPDPAGTPERVAHHWREAGISWMEV